MNILTVSGSVRSDSANVRLLKALSVLLPQNEFFNFEKLEQLPVFTADKTQEQVPSAVRDWQNALKNADAVIISTPEYLNNLPALLKNAFEWVTESGEFFNKKTLAITFCPLPPRGEKAMQSLLWTLGALNANVVAQLPLFQNEIQFDSEGDLLENESVEMLREAIKLL